MEHDQFSYFCRGPDDFCWGPAPVGPTLVTGQVSLFVGVRHDCLCCACFWFKNAVSNNSCGHGLSLTVLCTVVELAVMLFSS